MSDIVVGLDIGTCNVRVVIGTHDENGRLQIIGVGTAPSTGLSRGVIVNIENTISLGYLETDLFSDHKNWTICNLIN